MNPELVSQAATWRLIGLCFERPKAGWAQEVLALSREVSEPALREAAEQVAGAVETEYLALMGPGGPVPAREAGYRGRLDPGQILADIGGFHRAFVFEPHREDPADHVAVEAGFAGFLWLKEALAPDAEAAGVTRKARELFFAEHLGPLAAGLCARLQKVGDERWLSVARVAWEHSGRCATPGSTDDDEQPLACEGCASPSAGSS